VTPGGIAVRVDAGHGRPRVCVETIPEPATMLLLAGGIAGLIAVRRKKH